MTTYDGRGLDLQYPDLPEHEPHRDTLLMLGSAPTFVPGSCWSLRQDKPGAWRLCTVPEPGAHGSTQPVLLSCGAALEYLVVLLQGRGYRLHVQLLPDGLSDTVAVVTVLGRAAPTTVDRELLTVLQQPARTPLTGQEPPGGVPTDEERILTLAAEGLQTDVVWSSRDAATPDLHGLTRRAQARSTTRPMATFVTAHDGPRDWVNAGRAVARVALRARALGLECQPFVHALSRPETRRALQGAWNLSVFPQVQLLVGRP